MNFQNPRLVLVVIFLLFFAPVLLAVLMRSAWWDFTPAETSNLGALVQPPAPLGLEAADIQHPASGAAQRGTWRVLYPFPGNCERECRRQVAGLRQLHLATGRHRDRVAIVLLSRHTLPPSTLADLVNIYPEFVIANDPTGAAARVLEVVDPAHDAFAPGRAFLLDPPGNIILGYAPGFDPSHINKDLKRLLAWSAQDDQ